MIYYPIYDQYDHLQMVYHNILYVLPLNQAIGVGVDHIKQQDNITNNYNGVYTTRSTRLQNNSKHFWILLQTTV